MSELLLLEIGIAALPFVCAMCGRKPSTALHPRPPGCWPRDQTRRGGFVHSLCPQNALQPRPQNALKGGGVVGHVSSPRVLGTNQLMHQNNIDCDPKQWP